MRRVEQAVKIVDRLEALARRWHSKVKVRGKQILIVAQRLTRSARLGRSRHALHHPSDQRPIESPSTPNATPVITVLYRLFVAEQQGIQFRDGHSAS